MTKLKDKEDEAWQSGHQYGRLEREKEILEIIDVILLGVKRDMRHPEIKRTDIGIADGFAHLLKSKIKGQK
mgnify:CR=1 FL=1